MARIKRTSHFIDNLADERTSIAMVRKVDAAYIEGGTWRCEESPTGAHHWIRVTYDTQANGLWHCKYCNDFRIM